MRPPQFGAPILADAWVIPLALVFWMLLAVVLGVLLIPIWLLHMADKAWRAVRRG